MEPYFTNIIYHTRLPVPVGSALHVASSLQASSALQGRHCRALALAVQARHRLGELTRGIWQFQEDAERGSGQVDRHTTRLDHAKRNVVLPPSKPLQSSLAMGPCKRNGIHGPSVKSRAVATSNPANATFFTGGSSVQHDSQHSSRAGDPTSRSEAHTPCRDLQTHMYLMHPSHTVQACT